MTGAPHVPTIRAFLDDRHAELAGRAARFARERIAPLPPAEDDGAARKQAREILGLLAGEWHDPVLAGDLRGIALVREALAHASPLADAVYALQALGTTPIILGGSAALRDRWLPAVRDGRAMAAFVMTEPEAGSDLGAMTTSARADGGGWVLDGVKTLISNAGIADFYTVFATTDRSAGAKGIACFVVPADTPGLELVRPLVLSAPHPLGEIRFDGCRVDGDALLAGSYDGYKLGLATLDRLRATVAAAACGMAARALDEALAHARARVQFGKALAEFQLVQDKLARMATDLAAARLLTYRAAWAKDRGAERVTMESAMAKSFATEAAQRIVDDAVQIVGGKGVLAESVVDRLYRAVRALRIYEGTTEIQRLLIARHLVEGT